MNQSNESESMKANQRNRINGIESMDRINGIESMEWNQWIESMVSNEWNRINRIEAMDQKDSLEKSLKDFSEVKTCFIFPENS